MTTKVVFLSGVTKWAKLAKPDEKFLTYQLDLFMDEPSLAEFKASGLQLTLKNKGEGDFVTLRRPATKVFMNKTTKENELVTFGPPDVLSPDGNIYADVPLIGNGSHITCKVTVYDTMKGKGHRLEKVRIDKLVEYNPQVSGDNGPF